MNTLEFNTQVTDISTTMKPFALNLTRNLEDAQDLLQETIYKAMVNQKLFSEGTNLKSWVYTIMKNLFINDYRRKKARNSFLDIKEDLSFIKGMSVTSVNDGESNMGVEKITQNIDKLNNNLRVPFMMYFNGFKYNEIAEYLELPIGTIKSRIHLARKSLQSSMTEVYA